ncbi:MAG: sel1 repeat family protein [Synergistaceae bacterium]|nr:sel1 repeat family protein [Synergistaceae bacterium]
MFSREILQNIEIRRHFNSLAFSHAGIIARFYDGNVSAFNDILEAAAPKCVECIIASLNDAVSVLADNGVYDYDRSSFSERFGIIHAFTEGIDPIISVQAEISSLSGNQQRARGIQALREGSFRDVLLDAIYRSDVLTGYCTCVALAEEGKIAGAVGLVDESLLSRRLSNVKLQAAKDESRVNSLVSEIIGWVTQNPFSSQYYKELYLLAGDKEAALTKLCSLLGYDQELEAYKEFAGESILAGLKQYEYDTATMLKLLRKSRDMYSFTPSQEEELDGIERALKSRKESEDEITSAISANSQEESKADSLIEAGDIPRVWAMLDGGNGLTEYKLMEYYDNLVKDFVERRDFRNIERRMSYVYEQADSGNPFAEFLVNYIRRKVYMRAGDKDRVIRIDEKLLRLADRGQVSACAMVGFYCLDGQGYFRRDYGGALKYLTFAAEKNHPTAMAWLSDMYHNGNGVAKDERAARKWLELAAHYGHPYAARKINERR